MAPQAKSLLLELPAELRNYIVELAFKDTMVTIATLDSSSNLLIRKPEPPGLSLSCRQIYEETLDSFYDTAIFHANDSTQLLQWLARLPGPRTSQLKVKHVRIGHATPLSEEIWKKSYVAEVHRKGAEMAGALMTALGDARLHQGMVEVGLYSSTQCDGWTKTPREDIDEFMKYAMDKEYNLPPGHLFLKEWLEMRMKAIKSGQVRF